MKRLFNMLVACLAVVAFAGAEEQEQSGVPAKMTVITGKEVPVFLQSLQEGKLVFQIYRRPKNIPLRDISKVTRLDFLNEFDREGVTQLFNAGDYQGVVEKMTADLTPSLDEYWQYMLIENDFQNEFYYLMTAYLELDDLENAEMAVSILTQSSNPEIYTKAMTASIKMDLAKGDIEGAEMKLGNIDSEVGKLYLREIGRAHV